MITFIFFFFTMGKAYESKALQECNARYRLILNSHFGNAPTLGLYIGLDILVDNDCHFYYITKLKEKKHWSMLVSQHYGQQLFFWVNDIVIFFKLITKYRTFVLVCPWTRFFFHFLRNVGKKMEPTRLARLTFYMKVSNQQNRFQNNLGYKQVASFCGNIGTKSPKV